MQPLIALVAGLAEDRPIPLPVRGLKSNSQRAHVRIIVVSHVVEKHQVDISFELQLGRIQDVRGVRIVALGVHVGTGPRRVVGGRAGVPRARGGPRKSRPIHSVWVVPPRRVLGVVGPPTEIGREIAVDAGAHVAHVVEARFARLARVRLGRIARGVGA